MGGEGGGKSRRKGGRKTTHRNVVVSATLVGGGDVGQVLDHLLGVLRLTCSWLSSERQRGGGKDKRQTYGRWRDWETDGHTVKVDPRPALNASMTRGCLSWDTLDACMLRGQSALQPPLCVRSRPRLSTLHPQRDLITRPDPEELRDATSCFDLSRSR